MKYGGFIDMIWAYDIDLDGIYTEAGILLLILIFVYTKNTYLSSKYFLC